MEKETDYIYNIPKFAGKSTLAGVTEFLRRLRIDCSRFKIIHVAGTNGKGSVCAYLSNIIKMSGHTVGLFTSPHLVSLTERIIIDGEQVSEQEFEAAFSRAKAAAISMREDGLSHPAFFEFIFGMAMDVFSRHKIEYLVLETGLGGRLDATNIVKNPILTVITSISLDHTDILGDTYAQIAYEKAGIIKPGVPVVWADNRDDVSNVIRVRAEQLSAPMYPVPHQDALDIEVTDKGIDFLLHNRYYDDIRISVSSRGLYQVDNASLAAVAAKAIGLDSEIVALGIKNTIWSGRMQTLASGVTIDGAHNEDGIKAFLESVRVGRSQDNRVLMFSAVKDKHYEIMIKEISQSRLFRHIIITRINDRRGLDCQTIQRCFNDENMHNYELIENVSEAYRRCIDFVKTGYEVYVCGSLYLVGEVLRADKEIS